MRTESFPVRFVGVDGLSSHGGVVVYPKDQDVLIFLTVETGSEVVEESIPFCLRC